MEPIPLIQANGTTVPVTAFLQCTNLGGMERVAYSLFAGLQAGGFTLRIASARPWGPGRDYILSADPHAVAFNYQGKFGWRSFPRFKRHALAAARHASKVWVIGNCASCLMAARLSGKKTLLSHHYHHFESFASRSQWTAFYLAFGPGLEAITYPTDFTRNEALRIAPWLRSKTHVVRNGFAVHYTTENKRLEDKRAAREQLSLPPDAFLVGNAGWFIPRKRFDVFLQTAGEVSKRLPTARFHVCGGGPEENRLRRLARKLGIADKICFQGWVKDLTPYYQAWDALLFNSDFDALGNTPLEAAAHGCIPVASCRHGGLSEFLKDGQTGFLLGEHEPTELAERLVTLAKRPALAFEIRQQAVATLRQTFNPESSLGFYKNYFRDDSI